MTSKTDLTKFEGWLITYVVLSSFGILIVVTQLPSEAAAVVFLVGVASLASLSIRRPWVRWLHVVLSIGSLSLPWVIYWLVSKRVRTRYSHVPSEPVTA